MVIRVFAEVTKRDFLAVCQKLKLHVPIMNEEFRESISYFAFGSNLLSDRMHINNPAAVRRTTAKLKGYRLAFLGYADSWKGATATIIADKLSEVWGVVWQLPQSDLNNLDRQEAGYKAIEITVETAEGKRLVCRTYQKNTEQYSSKPSTVYKAVIVLGAIEQDLPEDYISKLRNIEDNGHDGPVDIPVDINKVLSALRSG